MIDDEVAVVLAEAPDFRRRYQELVEAADDDPGAAVTFAELADYVADLVTAVERYRPLLVRGLAAVEKVAETSEDAEDLVVWTFFDNLSPDDVRRLERWLGPRTRALLDEVDHSRSR